MLCNNVVMAEKKFLFQGKINEKIKDSINTQIEKHRFNVGHLVEAMAELWVSLPDNVQVDLYHKKKASPNITEIINQIVDNRLAAVEDDHNAALLVPKGQKRTLSGKPAKAG